MTGSPLQTLRNHRALLLGCEAIGWVHMVGKAHPDFLRGHGGQSNGYDFKQWFASLNLDWDSRMSWLKGSPASLQWPNSLTEFLKDFDAGQSKPSVVGLLQAAHAMASGIEKNHPKETSKYLGQDVTHMWCTSPFGHPECNLLANPPDILANTGPTALLADIERVLSELSGLANPGTPDAEPWAQWRSKAIGPKSLIRRSFLETLAETRVPNNDVTLWDQSYVAAALFKSAVAGALLAGSQMDWSELKKNTQWRVLTVGIGAEHYESRAVRIGDWTGARAEIDAFFDDVCRLVEVDVALGSLLYRDGEVMAFTFPDLRASETETDAKGSLSDSNALAREIDALAKEQRFETPPLVRLSEKSTRSFIALAKELDVARKALATPLHRTWAVPSSTDIKSEGAQHICPVCLVRLNALDDKQKPCEVCRARRTGRLNAWLDDKVEQNTIWISEVADHNDRVTLLTFSLGLEGWLDGSNVDSLRAQSIATWREHNASLEEHWQRDTSKRRVEPNPVDREAPFTSLRREVTSRLLSFDKQDLLLTNLQDGYRRDSSWDSFFRKLVEDRADAPSWNECQSGDERAAWLAHQLFRKNASPGRVHRFWRTSEAFFQRLLTTIRERAAQHSNRWRTRRLVLKANGGNWRDRETYHGVWRDALLGFVYRKATNDFVTITNLARCFGSTDAHSALKDQAIEVVGDDLRTTQTLTVKEVKEKLGPLGAYHPVIPLELSPLRFRVLVPLDAVDDILRIAKERWENEFARVWNRLPLSMGVVAFPRMTPFQAVIEAARNLEDALAREPEETWSVVESQQRDGVCATRWVRKDGEQALTTMPTCLPDRREDVYYPYLAVEGQAHRSPRDFQHPRGQVYRHVGDLRPGDGTTVQPSRFATVFLDSTARRFEPIEVRYLSEISARAALWALIRDIAPSMSALRDALSVIEDAREGWLGRSPSADERQTWLGFVRAVLHDKLGARRAALESLVDAARTGVLVRTLRWNLQVLKKNLETIDDH